LILLALISDYLGFGGQAGFGAKQIFIVVFGAAILLSGIFFLTPSGQRARKSIFYFLQSKEKDEITTDRKELFLKILITAVFFGLSTGFGETLFHIITKIFQNKVLYMSQHFVWMLPLVETVEFIIFGLIIFCFSLLWPKIASVRLLVFVFSLLFMLTIHFVQQRLNIYAALVLFIGISYQLSRFLGSRGKTFLSFERKSVPWMLTFLLAIMAGMIGWYG
jgi:hypothetical protein